MVRPTDFRTVNSLPGQVFDGEHTTSGGTWQGWVGGAGEDGGGLERKGRKGMRCAGEAIVPGQGLERECWFERNMADPAGSDRSFCFLGC
jgi:hypothetical protein